MGHFIRDNFNKSSLTMLYTCQESRQIYLENYTPIKLLGSSIASLWDEDAEPELSDIVSDISNTGEVRLKHDYGYIDN